MLGNVDAFFHFCPMLTKKDEYLLYCEECGHPILSGRRGRKFCCAACKNRWHNRKKDPPRDREVSRVVKILISNREILCKLVKMGITSIDRLTLLRLGFDLEYSTSFRWVGRSHQVFTCFDYTYELTPSRVKQIAWISPEMLSLRKGAGKRKAGGLISEGRLSSEDL